MSLTLTATRLHSAVSGNAAASSSTGTGPSPVLVVLPSLGTAVQPLWQAAAAGLGDAVTVIGIDLPGHGRSAPVAAETGVALSVPDLAEAVLACLDAALPGTRTFTVAGDSLGGAIALQLALDAPERIDRVAVFCTGARIGEPSGWEERASLVEQAGTPTQIIGSTQRWFAPGFLERDSFTATNLLHSLQDADRFSYAACCRALATFDVREELGRITAPVVAVAGAHDHVTGPDSLKEIVRGVPSGTYVEVAEAAHLVPAEAPSTTAGVLTDLLTGSVEAEAELGISHTAQVEDPGAASADDMTRADVRTAGMTVRREVLSDAHVDRAEAKKTDFTADFQDLISRYAWGEIWTRPGIDRRMRSAVTLTAMVAGGHEEELAMHVKAALRNGLTRDEIKEVLLQTAIYCSVPSANTAFKVAQKALDEVDGEA